MRKLRIILTIGFVLFSIGTYACSCIGESSVKGGIKQSDIVVSGKIISKEQVTLFDSTVAKLFGNDSLEMKGFPYELVVAKYQLVVTNKFKGKITSDTIEIYTGLGGGDCGVRFRVGEEYIVYGNDETYMGQVNNDWPFPKGKNIYWTNICTRTMIKNNHEIFEIEKVVGKKN